MKKKHIVFLFSDQHNGNIVGYGNDRYIRTPTLNKLAEKGTAFNNCYCASPVCVPSRSAMLSGQLPIKTGIFNNFQCLRSDEVTFVHSLSVAGYETVLNGRMHFIGPDQRHGFEKRLIGDIDLNYPHLPVKIYGEKLDGTDWPCYKSIKYSGAGHSAVLEYDKDVTNETVKFLKERKNEDRPLFLTVGFYAPHAPYVAPKELFDHYYSILPDPEPMTDRLYIEMHPAIKQFYQVRGIENVSAEETKRVRAAYYGMVEYLDELIGEIVAQIDKTLGLENTIIVYGSDHGDAIGENGLFWKQNLYEGSARVPLVYSSPGLIQENVLIEENISLLDIGPTFIHYTGAQKLPETDGISQLPVLTGKFKPSANRVIISQLADVKGDNPSCMIKKGPWKLIHHTGYDDVQLFNIQDDPKEKNDLGKDTSYCMIREELHKEVMRYWDDSQVWKMFYKAKAHTEIYSKWVKTAKVKGFEEWHCDIDKNYLE